MVLIQNMKKGRPDGGYTRLLGNSCFGSLLSKIHAGTISSGTELERIICERTRRIDTVDRLHTFLACPEHGVFIVDKKIIKKSLLSSTREPDFLVFEASEIKRHCYIIELKDGDTFDTKKANGEREGLVAFQNHVSKKMSFSVSIHVCSFNQSNIQKVYEGFKSVFTKEEIMIGENFCSLIDVNYQEIIDERKKDQEKNIEYVINELLKIKEIRDNIQCKLKDL